MTSVGHLVQPPAEAGSPTAGVILPKNVNKQYFQRCCSFLSLGLSDGFAVAPLHKYV